MYKERNYEDSRRPPLRGDSGINDMYGNAVKELEKRDSSYQILNMIDELSQKLKETKEMKLFLSNTYLYKHMKITLADGTAIHIGEDGYAKTDADEIDESVCNGISEWLCYGYNAKENKYQHQLDETVNRLRQGGMSDMPQNEFCNGNTLNTKAQRSDDEIVDNNSVFELADNLRKKMMNNLSEDVEEDYENNEDNSDNLVKDSFETDESEVDNEDDKEKSNDADNNKFPFDDTENDSNPVVKTVDAEGETADEDNSDDSTKENSEEPSADSQPQQTSLADFDIVVVSTDDDIDNSISMPKIGTQQDGDTGDAE